ncbi:related to transcription activator amyR [Phialocephala subalpina]|uniref:Related to transcription activator amyR n=1 Tax=Phialocephala subalpina TaxID=576137 RepID=A0A1L7WT51_9HELO|nr:related to transcription activator amyR [Phialocephala subalpina]
MSSTLFPGTRRISKVRQACDACHVRKVKCDGTNPCNNCISTDLQCTYLAVPKKKGPKGKRTVNNGVGPRPTQLPRPRPYNLNPPGRPARDQLPHRIEPTQTQEAPPRPKTSNDNATDEVSLGFRSSPLVTDELLRACVGAFFIHKYPIMPILHQETITASILSLGRDPERYGLLTALCAVIVQQPEILELPASGQSDQTETKSWPSSDFLIKETIRARQFCNHIESPTLVTVQASFFLFAALFCLGKDNSAWFYIRESMTMLQLLRLHEETTYANFSDVEYATYCRRTFWLLFLTERAYALQRHRPLTLQRTISLPTVDPGPEDTILSGFLDLVSLFLNFDDTFLSLWNLSETDSPASAQSLVQLQDILKFAIPNVSERTEIQQADLLVSRQWLKTMVWQLCVSKGLLSSASTNESMSFHYPVTIARDVVLVSHLLPPQAFEANGVGILEKVFDIGCSLADVLSLHPNFMSVSALKIGPRDYLMELVRILGTAPGGNKYLRLLALKADECLGVRIRSSLSESENSDRFSEEIEDEEVGDMLQQGPNFDAQELGESEMSHISYAEPAIHHTDNSEYSSTSINNHDFEPRSPLAHIGTGLFAHPILYTSLNRQNADQSFPISGLH